MAIANKIAGFSLGQADLLRRAMGKKKPEEMEKLSVQVYRRRRRTLFGKESREAVRAYPEFRRLWIQQIPLGRLCRCRYHTAYLKAHYPTEFMAALMTSDMGNADKMVGYFTECRDLGIRVLPPDVNESQTTFSVVDGVSGSDLRP